MHHSYTLHLDFNKLQAQQFLLVLKSYCQQFGTNCNMFHGGWQSSRLTLDVLAFNHSHIKHKKCFLIICHVQCKLTSLWMHGSQKILVIVHLLIIDKITFKTNISQSPPKFGPRGYPDPWCRQSYLTSHWCFNKRGSKWLWALERKEY